MPTSEELTDTYLSALLAREANEPKTNRLSARPRDAPKPNLRFLRNIIRETDSHNAVLLDKERRSTLDKPRHDRDRDEDSSRPTKRIRTERPDRWSAALGRDGLSSRSSKHGRSEVDQDRSSRPHREHKHRSHRRSSRSASPAAAHSTKHHRSRNTRQRSRSRSPSSRRQKSSSDTREYQHHQRPRTSPHAGQDPDCDSDPLEAIIGPRPPPKVKPRGRGTTAGASGIDARFADPSYDPGKDVEHDEAEEDNDDWEMAMSALHDRAKWRAIGADRLRAAGFDETAITKWENSSGLTPGGHDKDVDDVVWRKKGEARDWDRGKVLQEDGDVATAPSWAKEA